MNSLSFVRRAALAGFLIHYLLVSPLAASAQKRGQPRNPPITVSRLSMLPDAVRGGMAARGVVTLSRRADEATSVRLVAAGAGAAVPPEVTVEAGKDTAAFDVKTVPVKSPTRVVITAVGARGKARAVVTVEPVPVAAVTLEATELKPNSAISGRVRLESAAPATGVLVRLGSSNRQVVAPEPTVTVEPGKTTADFQVTTRAVNADEEVTISAASTSVAKSVKVSVEPLVVGSISIQAVSLPSNSAALAVVRLDAPAPRRGVDVTLRTNAPGMVSVPDRLRIPPGEQIASFYLQVGLVDTVRRVTVTATIGGVGRGAMVTVTP